jgi:GDP-6-deoxy-D-talose 4-dehydrogenase
MSAETGPRAFITGIDGFTGRYLAPLLSSAGYRVFGTTEDPARVSEDIAIVDLTKQESIVDALRVAAPDFIVHLAAISFVGHGNVDDIYRVNLLGTQHLLKAAAELCPKIRKILIASSANIYGNALVEPIVEEVSPSPANDYAVSKLAMEYMARLWFDRLPILMVRPFNYTGVGQSGSFLVPKIVSHFRNRLPVLELGNLDVVRDISDVRTVVDCYRRLLEVPSHGEIINVCSGVGHSLSEILQTATELTGYRPRVTVNPAFVRDNEVRRLIGSRKRLELLIGHVPTIPLRQTLRWMIDDVA